MQRLKNRIMRTERGRGRGRDEMEGVPDLTCQYPVPYLQRVVGSESHARRRSRTAPRGPAIKQKLAISSDTHN